MCVMSKTTTTKIKQTNHACSHLVPHNPNRRSLKEVKVSNENGSWKAWDNNGEDEGWAGKVKSYQPSALGSSGQRKFKREK